MNAKDDCIFCQIVSGTKPSSQVFRDERCTVFMDIRPINDGHVLVIPNRHAPHLSDLDPDDGAHLFQIAQQLAGALRTSGVPCEGVNLLLSDGRAAMQEVFHVHLHVIPRFSGDGFGLRFGPSFGRRPERGDLDAVAEKIKKQMNTNATVKR
jgi:histidine triad (HIT) family protein